MKNTLDIMWIENISIMATFLDKAWCLGRYGNRTMLPCQLLKMKKSQLFVVPNIYGQSSSLMILESK